MSKHNFRGVIILCAFFVIVLAVAFANNRRFPAYAFSGESSVGTWMSGVLLTCSATLSLIFGMQQQKWQWYIITAFFFLLAADERFMFHEQLKHSLIFNGHTRSPWIYELPVLAGVGAGVFISRMLWYRLEGKSRILLLLAVFFGTLSAGMDVMSAGVLLEDAFKLLAELSLACALLFSVDL